MDEQTTPEEPVQPEVVETPPTLENALTKEPEPATQAEQPDPQPEVVATETPTDQSNSVEVMDGDATKTFSWQASEFIHHQKKTGWYVIFAVVVVVLVAIAVVTHQWFSVAVFIAMAAALLVYANKEPRVLQYQLDSSGITIEQKHYSYDHFRSFAVFNDVAWHSIDFDPTQRFMPRLTVYFDTKDLDTIVSILNGHLPHVDREPDAVERITRNLKF